MSKSKIGRILEKINEHFDELQQEYNVKQVGIFGSMVRGEETAKSDVDVLIDFSRPVGFIRFIQLENILSKLLNKKVDLVTKKALKPAVRESILKEVVYLHA